MAKKRRTACGTICKGFLEGTCRYGASCWFHHPNRIDIPPQVSSALQPGHDGQPGNAVQVDSDVPVQSDDVESKAMSFLSSLRGLVNEFEDLQNSSKVKHDALALHNASLKKDIERYHAQIASLESEKSDLEQRLQNQHVNIGASGAEWQFEVPGAGWAGMPADGSAKLHKSFEEYSKGASTVVCVRSGVEEYTFDFQNMRQTNAKTGKTRKIRCILHTPRSWTRAISVQHAYHVGPVEAVYFEGFPCKELDGTYTKSMCASEWWKNTGDAWIQELSEKLILLKVTPEIQKNRDSIRCGGGGACAAICSNTTDPKLAEEWAVVSGKVTLKHISPPPPDVAPIMNVAVEICDIEFHCKLHNLLQSTVVHQSAHDQNTPCGDFKSKLRIARVLRIENWHLWSKYCAHKQNMRHDFVQHGIQVGTVEPPLGDALQEFARECEADSSMNECFLFHGTEYRVAVQVAFEGFDFRLSKAGYYGHGTYFASQACKSHSYGKPHNSLSTLVLSRVALGDPAYANKVDTSVRRPPMCTVNLRCHDSVIAKPRPMPGHSRGVQTHQEFVIFEKYQAYPEYIIQYALVDDDDCA